MPLAALHRIVCVLLVASLLCGGVALAPGLAAGESASWSPTVKKAAPSVVTVFTTKEIKRERMPMFPMFPFPFGDDEGQPFGPRGGPRRNHPGHEGDPGTMRQRGLGSGVVVGADGLILTNNHVIAGADDIRVALQRGQREYPAKLVGADPKTDLAVLRVEGAKDLVPIAWGDSDRIEIGDQVLAIGNPFGLGQTVTAGIISARGRAVGLTDYEDYLQTDAAINQGNSGGALVDAEGRLIGINTAILSPNGGSLGIGFAVPANLARTIMAALVDKGKVVRGFLGLQIQPVTPEVARAFKLPDNTGALVGDVLSGSPAEKAGVKAGDVVVEFAGKKIEDARQLRLLAAGTAPGTQVKLRLNRDGKDVTVEVTLKELPASIARMGGGEVGAPDQHARLGLAAAPLDEARRARLNVPANIDGLVVLSVVPGSRAAEAGIATDEVLVEAGRKPVRSAEDLAAAVNAANDDLVLRVWDRNGLRYVVVPMGEKR